MRAGRSDNTGYVPEPVLDHQVSPPRPHGVARVTCDTTKNQQGDDSAQEVPSQNRLLVLKMRQKRGKNGAFSGRVRRRDFEDEELS